MSISREGRREEKLGQLPSGGRRPPSIRSTAREGRKKGEEEIPYFSEKKEE